MNRARRVLLASGILLGLCLLDFGLDRLIEDSSVRQLILLSAINVMVAVSLNLVNGLAGQFSIGHAGFVGIGAYTTAIVASQLAAAMRWAPPNGGWEAPTVEDQVGSFAHSFLMVPLSTGIGALAAATFGLLVGLPSLRLRGDYLAIVTLGFAEIVRLLVASARLDAKSGISGFLASLGGQNGYAGLHGQGVPLFAGPFWIFGGAVAMVLAAWRIKFSGWGRALRALREDEVAAAAVGVDPTRYKVTAFVIAAGCAGAAGGLWATMHDGLGLVQPDQFNFQFSFDAITMVILGGSGSVSGAVLGALFVTFSMKAIELIQGLEAVKAFQHDHSWLDLNALRMVVYALVLIALMISRPEGLLGERELFEKKAKRSSMVDAPEPEANVLA